MDQKEELLREGFRLWRMSLTPCRVRLTFSPLALASAWGVANDVERVWLQEAWIWEDGIGSHYAHFDVEWVAACLVCSRTLRWLCHWKGMNGQASFQPDAKRQLEQGSAVAFRRGEVMPGSPTLPTLGAPSRRA